MDNCEYSIGIFLDLAKAFDTVNHKILLNKLGHYGIRGIPHLWFKNYLSNRKKYVHYKRVGSQVSDIMWRSTGVSTWATSILDLHQ